MSQREAQLDTKNTVTAAILLSPHPLSALVHRYRALCCFNLKLLPLPAVTSLPTTLLATGLTDAPYPALTLAC